MLKKPFLICVALSAAAIAGPRSLAAQEAPIDSLRAEIRAMRARIDSLVQALNTLQTERERSRAQAELDKLREAAAAAARGGEKAEDADEDRQFVGRERAQQALNPEISITGDVVGFVRGTSDGERSVIPREFEFSFQTAIDPFARTKIFITREEGIPQDPNGADSGDEGFEIEEAYAYWVGLPGGFSLDVGKFRQQLGGLNRWHTHALPEVDRPLVVREIVGEDGLIQTGASLYWIAPVPGSTSFEFWFQLTGTENDVLVPGGSSPSFLTRVNVFRELSAASYIQLGGTGLYAQDDDADNLRARLASVDLTFNWRPPARALYREFTLRGALLWADQRLGTTTNIARGGYGAAYYRLGRHWNAGLRLDLLDPFDGGNAWQTAATLTYFETEFLRVRGQWNHLDLGDQTDNQFMIQLVWAVGPHRDETY